MATTASNFVLIPTGSLLGTSVVAKATLAALGGPAAVEVAAGGNGTIADKVTADLSKAGFAKNGAIRLALSGTTAKTIDLTDLTSAADTYAGDTTFSKFNQLVLYNDGAADVTFAPGGSNPASVGLAGTTPTLTIPAGKAVVLNYADAGVTVDSTHKTISITPTSGGSFILCVGGA